MSRHNPTFVVYDDDGEEIHLPAKRAVCHRCNGNGTHGNPAFDGTTTDWWLEGDPDGDDLRSYMDGGYDVVCEECHGNKVVDEVDRDALTPEQARLLDAYERDLWESYEISRQERMMGA